MITIDSAILGLLSRQAMTGYDIKKIFTDSEILYWSGNNNQIYTSLVKLHQKGLVTLEIELQADKPSRKIYSISKTGLEELRTMLLSEPEPPQITNPFLIQLAWADQLEDSEIDALLARYEDEMQLQVSMLDYKSRRKNIALSGKVRDAYINPEHALTPREALIWKKIEENWLAFYRNELKWVRELRSEIHQIQTRSTK